MLSRVTPKRSAPSNNLQAGSGGRIPARILPKATDGLNLGSSSRSHNSEIFQQGSCIEPYLAILGRPSPGGIGIGVPARFPLLGGP